MYKFWAIDLKKLLEKVCESLTVDPVLKVVYNQQKSAVLLNAIL